MTTPTLDRDTLDWLTSPEGHDRLRELCDTAAQTTNDNQPTLDDTLFTTQDPLFKH